jgi:hypothetical protein
MALTFCRFVMAHAIVEHLPDMLMSRGSRPISLRPDLVVQHVHERAIGPGAAGRVLAFTPADDAVIGLDAQDRRVERRQLAEVAPVLIGGSDGYAHPPGLALW